MRNMNCCCWRARAAFADQSIFELDWYQCKDAFGVYNRWVYFVAFDLSLSLSFSLLSTHAKYRHENAQVNRKKLKWFTYKLIGMISSFRAIHAINVKHWIPLRPNFMEGLFCIRRVKSIQYISDSSFPMKWRQKQREKTKRETDRFFWNLDLTQVSKQKSIVLYWMLVRIAQV